MDIGAAFVFAPSLLEEGLLSIQREGHLEAGHSPLLQEPDQQEELAAPFIQLRATVVRPHLRAQKVNLGLLPPIQLRTQERTEPAMPTGGNPDRALRIHWLLELCHGFLTQSGREGPRQ